MKRPEPWMGRLVRIEADLDDRFLEDLAAMVLEELDSRLAFEAWADQRGDS